MEEWLLRNVKVAFLLTDSLCCVADYCELAVCNGDSFNFSLTVEPDVEIRHDAITVQEKTDNSNAKIGVRSQSCWYGRAGDWIRTNLIVILFLVGSLCFQLIPIST